MGYTVVKFFTDLEDQNYTYEAGDSYPRAGLKPTKKRISQLSSSKNKQGTPLIEKQCELPKQGSKEQEQATTNKEE